MTAETDLLPLPEPVAVKYPDSGLRDDEHALRLWVAHGYDTGGEPLFSAEQLREAVAPLQAEVEALRAEVDALREALECMIIGACAVAVPHNGERAVLQDAVNIARAALAAYRKGGKQ